VKASAKRADGNDVAPAPWWELAPALLDRAVVTIRSRAAGTTDTAELLPTAQRNAEHALDAFQALLEYGDDAFTQVCGACELDEVEAAVLAVLAACEIDADVLRVACSLNDRASGRPGVKVLYDLFGPDGIRAVAAGGRLDRAGLIELETTVSLIAAAVAVPHAVIWRLLDEPADVAELGGDTHAMTCPPTGVGLSTRVLVHGDDRIRRLQTAIAQASGVLFYVGPPPPDDTGWRALTRRASLDGAGIVVELSEPPNELLRRWIERCDHLSWAVASRHPLDIGLLPPDFWADLAAPAAEATVEEWTAQFPHSAAPARRPTAGQLHTARSVIGSAADPHAAIRRVASGTLLRHATRITPRVGWDELILPDAQERRLRQLVDRYRYRGVVHDDWGLPLYPSPGVVALFSGPSGTGKTTTAEVIAHELGVDMFRVDLSALVSKYIGETEKNLEEIFSAAHAGDYLLLFDEADSLFGTRSKVSDARDRYANMEVSYLLQRLETYDGFVVLTSNFQGNIDQAFLRRIHVTVHFAVPAVEDRARIWDRSLGNAPRDDLDLAFVADKFDLTGGSIRNAALTSAFYAAGGRRAIGMADVLLAITQEMIKLGRRPNDDQYGPWLTEVKA
jgi:hypothetical protein